MRKKTVIVKKKGSKKPVLKMKKTVSPLGYKRTIIKKKK